MEQQVSPELTAEDAALLEPDIGLRQNHTFGLIAGRCSAAQAEGLRRLHDEKQYTKMH